MSATLWAQVSVVDDLGQPLVLTQPASRIVSLAPHITENIYAVGAGALLVGAVDYSDYPEAARTVPRVGDAFNLNIERILSLKPDLVVAWMDGTSPAQLNRLEQLGIPVLRESPDSFSEIARSLRRLGVLTGQAASAETAALSLETRIERLQQRYQDRDKLSVFYQVWHQPLITANGSQLIDQIIRLCGGHNLFADRPEAAPRVNIEAVIAAAPDLILSAARTDNSQWKKIWKPWRGIKAVQYDLLYSVNADLLHRSTLRAVEGAEQVCTLMDQARERLKQDA
ncbi:MAG: cobalamin-binding protein [Pontibacterium sp.]